MNTKPIIIIGLVAVVVAIPLIKSSLSKKAKSVEVATPVERVIETAILASGRLAHEDQVRITTEVIGRVTELMVEEGDAVAKGDLLLTIDDEAFKASVAQQKANVRLQQISIERQQTQLENLEKQWSRNKRLHKQKLLDDDAFEIVSNNLDVARIDLKSAREALSQSQASLAQAQDQLNKTRVYAPIDGVVTSLDIKMGETAIASSTNIAGSSLMTVANPSSIITEVFVDEADVADIQLGQAAEIVAIAYPDKPLKGVVKSIATTAKTAQGRQGLSFLVKLQVTDTQSIQLRPGMSCRAEIYTNASEPLLSIPIGAIITDEKRSQDTVEHFVFVVEDGVVEKRSITVGNSDDSYQSVTSGLESDEQIVVGPNRVLRHLTPKDVVEITTEQSIAATEPKS